jgi:GntR family transcriptional regulator, rspAB operon transcriptional repressor
MLVKKAAQRTNAEAEKPYGALPQLQGSERGGLTGGVACALREAIISMEFGPGMMIDKIAVCDRMGVSLYPVSAALARLEAEGLVEVLAQRGTRVTRIALDAIEQHLFIRSALEAETVRTLAPSISDEVLKRLGANVQRQREALLHPQPREFHALDLEFHETLQDALSLPRVKDIVGTERNALDRARQLLFNESRGAQTMKEHARILRALKSRDAERAAEAMRQHLDMVATELHRFATQRPDLFDQ